MRELHTTSLILAIIGGLNWGVIGLFNVDLVAALFGEMSFISRAIYVIIGIAAFILLLLALPRETSSHDMNAPSGKATR